MVLSFEVFIDRAGNGISLDLVGMFLSPNDILRCTVLSVLCADRLTRRIWLNVSASGITAGTIQLV